MNNIIVCYIIPREFRCIFDTNIYGLVIEEKILFSEIKKALDNKKLIIYGVDVVRKELRNTPLHMKIGSDKLRLKLLDIYDNIVGNRMFETTNLSKSLAKLYLKEYKSIKGIQSSKKIYTDFLIVAIASLNNMDIIITEDNKTMCSNKAKRSYNKINIDNNLNPPNFIGIDFVL